jgi:hypothetical protein
MDIDRRLHEAGQRWRESQGPALQPPSPASLRQAAPPRLWRKGLAAMAAAAAVAAIIFGFVTLHGATTASEAIRNLRARQANPTDARHVGLGPGCGIPAVDMAALGSDLRAGKPVIPGVVGQPTIVHVNIDPDRPQLKTTATVIVAAPGTLPGHGFSNPSQHAPGSLTLDDSGNWKASLDIAAQTQKSTQNLTFVPKVPGLYPVYVIEHATSTATPPTFCGGIPDKGGDAQNVVGWIQVP